MRSAAAGLILAAVTASASPDVPTASASQSEAQTVSEVAAVSGATFNLSEVRAMHFREDTGIEGVSRLEASTTIGPDDFVFAVEETDRNESYIRMLASLIFLTARGERFTDETASWDTVLADLTAAGGSEFWVITDSRSRKGATFATKVQQGLVESAVSLKELAKKMNISSAQLSEVFARYNEAARTGADPDFGRTRFLQELKEPPFYFGRERFEVHYTCGGIAINPKAEVLYAGSQKRPVLGLYAAGEVTGGVHGKFRLGGSGLLDAFVFGRIAGRNAAQTCLIDTMR